MRQILQTQPDKVNITRLNQSVEFYRQATSLSPQNVQLWNELATVQLIQSDFAGAEASLERSLAQDQSFLMTYMLQGDVLDAAGDKPGALAAYRKAAVLAPNDLGVIGAVGVFSAQTGDTQGALDAFGRIVDTNMVAMNSFKAQLDQLEQQAKQAGGYDRWIRRQPAVGMN